MKKLFLIAFIGVYNAASAQDWSWTFQWGSNRYGILFEDANLENAARCVIKDDLERTLSSPFLSSGSTLTYTVSPNADGFTGYVSLGGIFKGFPDGLDFIRYTEHSGTNFFHVPLQLSQKYCEKVVLTNAYSIQSSNLGNFFHSVSNMPAGTINASTRTNLAAKFWVASENRIWTASDLSSKSDEEIAEIISYRFLPTSILDFETKQLYGTNRLWCNARVAINGTPPRFDGIPLVSVTNAWFFCNWW
jgi:hypothetical protein